MHVCMQLEERRAAVLRHVAVGQFGPLSCTPVGLGGAVREAGASVAGSVTVMKESWRILFTGALSARLVTRW